METITTFVLGAISALGLLGLGYAFFMALKINKETKNLQKDIEGINSEIGEMYKRIDKQLSDTHQEIDNRIKDLYIDIEKITEDVYRKIDELNRYVDSRFDKQADKAGNVISVVSEASLRNGERLDKLDELFKLQMDQFARVTLNHSERLAELETDRKIEQDKIEQINS